MHTLSQEQFDAFRAERISRTVTRICSHLAVHWQDDLEQRRIAVAQLQDEVDLWVRRSLDLGFRSERDIRIFCEACVVAGGDFPLRDCDADIRSALHQASTSTAKAQLVDEYLMTQFGR